MQQQAVAQFADGHGRLVREIFQHARRRRVAQKKKCVADECERRLMVEKFRVGDGMIFSAGQIEAVRKGKLLVAVFQMRRERYDLTLKMQRLAVVRRFQPVRVAPACEPLQQFAVGQNHRVRAVVAIAVRVGDPLDEFPVGGRKQFLLMRRADDQVNHVVQRARLLARARARQKKLHGETMSRRLFVVRLHLANDAQRGARRVEQRH